MSIEQNSIITNSLISVGIDIGTTTTHLTFSRLFFSNRSSVNQAPKLSIDKKVVIFESRIAFTPLNDDGSIDGAAVVALIKANYEEAHITPEAVQTGAIIITGESAMKRNAPAIVAGISDLAGDFVSESAGANLESILAGRGSGCDKESLEKNKTIANIDIGGGTCNIAVFSRGRLLQTACLNIGARFIQFAHNRNSNETREIVKVTSNGQNYLSANNLKIPVGTNICKDILTGLADQLGQDLIELISNSLRKDNNSNNRLQFLWSDELSLCVSENAAVKIDEYWFTGGVGALMELFENDHSIAGADTIVDDFAFDDMGILLAHALIKSLKAKRLIYKIPNNAIRATVIGAGHNSVQLTGSTIGISGHERPLRNIRIIRPPFISDESALNSISKTLKDFEINWDEKPYAVVLDNHKLISRKISFQSLKALADDLATAVRELNAASPVIFITKFDMAMALGQLLKELLPENNVLVLDGIDTETGDFMDIGTIIEKNKESATATIPVIIKSLIFR